MKYLNISKIAVIIFTVAAMFTACSEDEVAQTNPDLQNVVVSGEEYNPPTNGKFYTKISKEIASKNKGFYTDASTYLTEGTAYEFNSSGNQYKTLKVPKADGTFFFIMIENLRYV